MLIRGAGRNFVVRYALEQIVRFVALMFAVSFVVFALVSASPIDPVQMNVGQAAYMTMSEAKRAQDRKSTRQNSSHGGHAVA